MKRLKDAGLLGVDNRSRCPSVKFSVDGGRTPSSATPDPPRAELTLVLPQTR